MPPVKYNYLKDEEAEARFEKRNKTLNYFSIMVSKRIKESEGGAEEEKGAGSSVVSWRVCIKWNSVHYLE